MRKSVLISFLLLSMLAANIYAQDVNYHYDNAGNRIERVIELKSAQIAGSEAIEQQVFDEILGEHEIKIYPNPTDGFLSVSISSSVNLPEGRIILTDMNGRTILTKQIETGLIAIDISGQPVGFYIMRIDLGTETTSWKIIKK